MTKIADVLAKPHRSAILDVKRLLSSGVEEMKLSPDEITTDEEILVTVAVQQENILATAFHPELTNDDRFHRYFLKMVLAHKTSA